LSYAPDFNMLVNNITCNVLEAQGLGSLANLAVNVSTGSFTVDALTSYVHATSNTASAVDIGCVAGGGASTTVVVRNVSGTGINAVQLNAGAGGILLSAQTGITVTNQMLSSANTSNGGYLYSLSSFPSSSQAGTTLTCAGKAGKAVFTGVTILSGGTQAFTITNAYVGNYGLVSAEFACAATSSCFVQSAVFTAGVGIVVTVVNGGAFTTTASSFSFTFISLI